MKIETVKAVAYEILSGGDGKTGHWVLCRWAEPSEFPLTDCIRPRPTPEARLRRVRIIRETDYLALLKTVRRLSEKEAR